MTHWLTIALILCPALFAVRIGATDDQQLSQQTMSSSQKSIQQINDNRLLTKRAAFMPSRGKKETEMDVQYADDKRSAFMPMRGRKDSYGDDQQMPQRWYVGGGQPDDKRAGFMPMRGRKNSAYGGEEPATDQLDVYPVELNDEAMKRSAFMPMRGRKDDFAYDQTFGRPAYAVPEPYRQSSQSMANTNWMEGERSLRPQGSGPELEKKANAFFGARGKRSAVSEGSDSVGHQSIGQSAHDSHHKNNENFFATRG